MILTILLLMIGQALYMNAWYYILLAMVFLWRTFATALVTAVLMKE